MRRHPRAQKVAVAQARIQVMACEISLEEGLTDAELMQGLAMHLASLSGYVVRAERYPNGDNDAQTEET